MQLHEDVEQLFNAGNSDGLNSVIVKSLIPTELSSANFQCSLLTDIVE